MYACSMYTHTHTHTHTHITQRFMNIVGVSEEEMAKRKAAWKAPPLKASQGTLYKYIKSVSSASEGCVTDGP